MSQIINGKEVAAGVRAEVAEALSNETSIIVGHLLVPSLLYCHIQHYFPDFPHPIP